MLNARNSSSCLHLRSMRGAHSEQSGKTYDEVSMENSRLTEENDDLRRQVSELQRTIIDL